MENVVSKHFSVAISSFSWFPPYISLYKHLLCGYFVSGTVPVVGYIMKKKIAYYIPKNPKHQ